MQKKILELIYNISLKKGKQLLIFMAIITLILGFFIIGGLFIPGLPVLKISSSRADLISKTHPDQARYLKYMEEFGAADNLIVVLDGDPDDLKSIADDTAEEILKQKKWVKSVFYKIDTLSLIKNAPLFIPADKLKEGIDIVKKNSAEINGISRINNLNSLLGMVKNAANNPAFATRPDLAPGLISAMDSFIGEWQQWIKNPKKNKIDLADKIIPKGNEMGMLLKSEGYLFSKDFKLLFMFVQPQSSNDDMSYLKPFVGDIKKTVDSVIQKNPELKGKVKAAYTGMPAHTLSETETLYKDVAFDGSLAIIFVAIVLLIGFRSFRKMIIAVIPILSGLIITLGVIALTVGRLNLISSAMIAVLFGIGIDFGIYLIQRTEEELGNGLTLEQAAYRSVVETSQSIVTGGFTTGLAFFAIGFSSFVGFSELGITAGMGIMIMLMTTFMFLPALIIHVGVEPKKYDVHGIMTAAKTIHRKKPLIAFGVVTILLTIFSIFCSFNIKMDYNALKLLPRNTESTIYQERMEETSDYKMSSAAVTAKSLDELTKMTAQIKKLSTVSRVDSLAELIPDNQAEKIKIIQQYREILGGINLTYIPSNLSAAEYSIVIKGLIEFFENYQEKAFAGGMKDIEDQLDKLLISLNALNEEFTGDKTSNAVARTNDFDKTLFSRIKMFNMLIQAWLNPEPMSEKNLSETFVNRFKSSKGTYVAYVFPNGQIWDVDFLDKFVSQVKNITPEVTGFPVTHRVYSRQAASAIFESIIYSFIMVVLLLWIEFRSFRTVAIAFIPLALGIVWMQSVIYIIGMPYNLANIAGLPLLFGLGVVYGVRIVHRWLENPGETAFIATRTTGKGVFFAASATLIALFSIIFARHYGMSSFGVVLFIGLAFCLVAALFVLPVIIDLLYLDSEKKK